jgi:hypothetical protein
MQMEEDKILEQLEELQMVQYRMSAEGFHYCFKSYSSFQEVEDPEFHRLRQEYLKAADQLEQYVNQSIEDLQQKIEN